MSARKNKKANGRVVRSVKYTRGGEEITYDDGSTHVMKTRKGKKKSNGGNGHLPVQKLPVVIKGTTPPAKKSKGLKKTTGTFKKGVRCYHTHKPLPLCDGLFIHGGSCVTPVVSDADIYIGFDHNMNAMGKDFPWNEGCAIHFKITDMKAPSDPDEFKKMVEWTAEQIKAGKKVHAGCIGGHGRTGTFFAALVKHMMGIDDAITYVREHYCERVVESEAQINFLHKHYGITKVKATKAYGGGAGDYQSNLYGWGSDTPKIQHQTGAGRLAFDPLTSSKRNIWSK